MVKIEEFPAPFETEVMVNNQDDQYMGSNGVRYVLTQFFEDMDPARRLPQMKAQTQPLPGARNV